MDKEAFLKVVNNVKEITDNDLEDLLETSKFYPYCQNIHILIAKKYHDLQHGLASAKLHKAAIYTPDRLHLKKIMEDDPSLIKNKKSILEAPAPEQKENYQKPQIQEEELPKEEVSENTTESISEEINTGAIINEEKVKIDSNKETESAPVISNQNIDIPKEEEKELNQKTAPPEKEDIRAELERNIKEYKERRQQEQKSNESRVEEISEKEPETKIETVPNVDLIHVEENTVEITESVEASNINEEENIPKDQEEENKTLENQLDQHQIIENFINLNPSLARFDLKFDEDQKQLEDLSIPKLTIGEHLISENLAVILSKQGKVQKAINIYEKLILKFPEKKAYFASCIEKIKNP